MSRILAYVVLVSFLMLSFTAAENELTHCNCDEVGFWTVDNILECQKVSDFLIALAYFSIPVELLYFVSCTNFPFRWVLLEFIAFIVLCGMTHLLSGWSYGPHSFRLMLAVTVFKVLTAFVSCATAITLISILPLLLKVKIRELRLREKTWDLGRKVGMIKKQTEAGMHVRMLTQEIRKSLDRHTILYTTLVELSKTLNLQNCAIWMPNEDRTVVNLLHELKLRKSADMCNLTFPRSDQDVSMIKESHGVKLLSPQSKLAVASSGCCSDSDAGFDEQGPVAAIRMPILKVSNFKGGTPELVPACYAILVLVLPGGTGRSWSGQELEIVEVVADQVTVALSHAALLEESQHMREQLEQQNRALQIARENALMANRARNAFQMGMSKGLRTPMHSILGLVSLIQDENLNPDQKMLVGSLFRASNVLSMLINDTMDTSARANGKFPLEMKPFQLQLMIKEAVSIAKCLSVYKGYNFSIEIDKCVPDYVVGDERRVFQVILHMIGSLLKCNQEFGALVFRVILVKGSQGRNEGWGVWKSSNPSDLNHVYVRFEVGVTNQTRDRFDPTPHNGADEGLSFNICRKIVQLMQGDIWVVPPNQEGFDQSMALILRFPKQPPSNLIRLSEPPAESSNSSSQLNDLKILLVDGNDVNRAVTRKLLEKLGCIVTCLSSGVECQSTILGSVSSFQMALIDLHLQDLDGFEVAIRIQKLRSRRNRFLIVALTASDDEAIWERCFEVGIHGLIQKPVLLQGIKDELLRVIQANRTVGSV